MSPFPLYVSLYVVHAYVSYLRVELNVRSLFLVFLHSMHWGKVFQLNPEPVYSAIIANQLVSRIWYLQSSARIRGAPIHLPSIFVDSEDLITLVFIVY